ncbi:unnamed protein product [Urochloa humidicola]
MRERSASTSPTAVPAPAHTHPSLAVPASASISAEIQGSEVAAGETEDAMIRRRRRLTLAPKPLTVIDEGEAHQSKVIFRATYWSRFWAQLSKEEETLILKAGCRNLEAAALEVTNKFGWCTRCRIEA